MLLENRTAIVHGGAGAIGSAVARAYAREGARVHVTGRTEATLERVVERIRRDGGTADLAPVDVLDRTAVERHATAVAESCGGIDVCFNATANDDVQGTPLVEMQLDDFLRPVIKAVTAHFAIATAAARHMKPHGSGVILAMAGGREAIPRLGGSHVAWAALAGVCRQLAAELGPHGVRVAWLLSPGSPGYDEGGGHDDVVSPSGAAADTDGRLLPRRPSYEDVANIAVFAACDWARTMTATEINLTAGAVID